MRALSVSEAARGAGIAGAVTVVAGGASSDEEVAGDTSIGFEEGVNQAFVADHIKTSIVCGIASVTTSD